MSREVDERIVSLQFDNSRFERNVSTTMSTLDKLKAKLNFNSAHAFDGLETSAARVSLNPLHRAFDLLTDKTAWASTAAITAMANISNSAIHAGEKMVKALTIDPVTTGFNEYELKMNSVQTIMSSTGESIETVNKYLDELNTYSDRTIYSFSDMTTNIGKFTNAGVKLDDAVAAMKGISNEAAISGANANEASRAMYNLAQSLSMGYVQYIDWKSIENANMATVDFKQNLADMAVKMGTVTQVSDDLYEVGGKTYNLQALFKDAMKDQWLTSEVLIEQLKMYSDETTELGRRAYSAAEDIKTFSQLWDTLGEAAQSGWAESWQLIVGDLTEAKTMLKRVAAPLDDLISKSSDLRNMVLGKTFTSGFTDLKNVIEKAGMSTEEFEDKLVRRARVEGVHIDTLINEYGDLRNAIAAGGIPKDIITDVLDDMAKSVETTGRSFKNETEKLEHFQEVVDQVWAGDWSNNYDEQREREKLLTDAHYDFAAVQELVNKSADGYRLTLEDLNSEQMRNLGFTDDEIKAVSELQLAMKSENSEVSKMIEQMSRPNGRFLLLDTIRSVFENVKNIIGAVQGAFSEVFGQKTADGLWNLINGLHNIATAIELTKEKTESLQQFFSTMFMVLDMAGMTIGRAFEFIFKIVSKIFKGTTKETKSFQGGIYNLVKALHEMTVAFNPFEQAFKAIEPILEKANKAISRFFGMIADKKDVAVNFIEGFEDGIKDKAKGMYLVIASVFRKALDTVCKVLGIHSPSKEMYDIATFVGEGFINGLLAIKDKIINLVTSIFGAAGPDSVLGSIAEMLSGNKVQNKVKKSYAGATDALVGQNKKTMASINAAFDNTGLTSTVDGIDTMRSKILTVFGKLKDMVSDMDWGAVMSLGIMAGILKTVKELNQQSEKIVNPINQITSSVSKVMGKVASTIGEVGLIANETRKNIKSDTFKNYAESVLMIAGSFMVIVFAMKQLKDVDMASIGKGIIILGALTLLTWALSKFGGTANSVKDGLKSVVTSGVLVVMALAIGLVVGCIAALMLLYKIDSDATMKAAITLGAIMVVMGILMIAITKLAGKAKVKDVAKVGFLFLSLSASLAILAISLAILSLIKPEKLVKMGEILLGFVVIMGILAKLTAKSKTTLGVGVMMMGFASAMIAVAIAMKILATMSPEDILKGVVVIVALGLVFSVMSIFARNYNKFSMRGNKGVLGKSGIAGSSGAMFLGFALSLLVIAAAIKMIGMMSEEEIFKGVAVIAAISLVFDVMMLFTRGKNKNLLQLGTMMIMMSVALTIIAGLCIVLGSIKTETAVQGVLAISVIMAMFAVVLYNVKGISPESIDAIKLVTACITVLAVAVLALGVMKPDHALAAAFSLALIMGAMALVFSQLKDLELSKATTVAVIGLSVMIAVLAGVCVVLAKMTNTDRALKAAGSLSMVMVAMAAVYAVIAKFTPQNATKAGIALASMVILTAVVAALAYIFYKLKDVDADGMVRQAAAISITLIALAGVTAACAAIGKLANGWAFLGVLALDALLVSLIAIAEGSIYTAVKLFKSLQPDIEDLAGTIGMLGEALGKIGDATQNMDNANINSVVDMLGVIESIAALNLVDKDISVAKTLSAFCETLPEIGRAMCEFSQALGEGFDGESAVSAANAGKALAELEKNLPRSGGRIEEWIGKRQNMGGFTTSIVMFGGAIKAFADTITADGGIDYEAATNAANAGLAIAKLEKNLPRSGGSIEEWIGKRQNMTVFSGKLKEFGTAIREFAKRVTEDGGVDYDAAEKAANAGLAIAKLEAALPRSSGRIEEWIGQRQNMTVFSGKMKEFGTCVKQFALSIAGDGIDYGIAEKAANAGKVIAELESKLPRSGGKIDEWIGSRQNMTVFSGKLKEFGTAIREFSQRVTADGGIDYDAAEKAARAGQVVAELESGLNKHGGINGNIFGDADLGDFGEDIGKFAEGIATYAEKTQGMKFDDDASTTALNAAKTIAEIENTLGSNDGIIDKLINKVFGDNDLETFGQKLGGFGTAVKTFSENVDGVDALNIKKGAASIGFINDMSDAWDQEKINKLAVAGNIDYLDRNLQQFAEIIVTFGSKFENVDTMKLQRASESLAAVISATSNIKDGSYTGLSQLAENLGSIGDASFDSFMSSFENSDERISGTLNGIATSVKTSTEGKSEDFRSAGKILMDYFNGGLKSKQDTVRKDFGTVVEKVCDVIEEHYQDWYDAGSYVVSGFANGISENITTAFNAAGELATDALKGLTLTLDIHSPSRETYAIGEYTVAGLVNALNHGAAAAEEASMNVGESTKKGMNRAIDSIIDGLGSIDTNPVITPVLNLDNITSGMNSINGMLNTAPELNARLNTITKSMGGIYDRNDPLVDAIGKIKPGSNVTNIIEGITYDDGSNINSAVETLISAAMVERRV